MNKILVAIDGSDSAAEALEFAVELADEHGAELILAHVVPAVDLVPVSGFGFAINSAFPHEPTLEDRALLEDAATVAEEHDVRATTVLLTGNTVDEIVAYADSHNVDLIVVGSRGHGTIATALLGSVSRGILGESKRPVLIVRQGAPVPHSDVRRHAEIGMGF
jgi:nucleotide-binding universal stress UspA family protein